ncbi:MAG: iron ABC transporter substrate-binding protein [Acidimicrobiales bacterium]
MTHRQARPAWVAAALALAVIAAACGNDGSPDVAGQAAPTTTDPGPREITVYSGRAESLVAPLLQQFTRDTGVKVNTRYADSSALAAQLVEEGGGSPADVFFSQDAGALGALSKRGLLAASPAEAVSLVDGRFRAKDNTWVGVSGRARVIVHNPERVPASEVPRDIFAVTDPKWKGRVGIAPTNASFQSFVTGMRVKVGDARTRQWLAGLKANDPRIFNGNAPIVAAVDEGQVDLGLVNHYYLYQRITTVGADKVKARNAFTTNGDPGALVNIAGVGILRSTRAPAASATFVNYVLSPPAQAYFAEKTFEYPMVAGVATAADLPALTAIQSPDVDLSDLDTLETSLAMLREVGLL